MKISRGILFWGSIAAVRGAVCLFTGLACFVAGGVQHIAETADFVQGENTNGWTISSSSWTSPAYPAPVDTFTLSATNLSEGSSLQVSYAGGAFTVSSADAAQLTAFTAHYTLTRLESPANVMITNVVDGNFRVTWSPVTDATGYRVDLSTNRIEGASEGTALLTEAFSYIPSKGNATGIDPSSFDGLTDTRAGWGCAVCYYGIAPCSNVVQIGSSSTSGYLSLPVPENIRGRSTCTLEISARRFNSTTAPDMPITSVTASGVTNLLGVLTLKEGLTKQYLTLPVLVAGDVLYFHSATNKLDGRVILEGVRILDGYSAGAPVPCCFQSVSVPADSTEVDFDELPRADISVCVTALAENSTDNSLPSAAVMVDMANPPLMPVLRAFPLSHCVEGVYLQDFGALSNITAKTSWYNGVWPLPYWMGYNDQGEPIGTIGKAAVTASTSGFFAFTSTTHGDSESVRALGFRGASDRDFTYGIAFLNDTGLPRTAIAISYEGVQWNRRNTSAMTNTFEYLVTNELVGTSAPGNWVSVPALDFTPPWTTTDYSNETDEWWGGSQSATLDGVTLAADQYLVIRWSDARGSAGGVGVSNFRLSTTSAPFALSIIIR